MRIYHPEDRTFVEEAEKQLVSEGKAYDIKYRIVRPDGELRWIREVGTPVYQQEVVTRYIGACLDVTEQEHLTQELRRREKFAPGGSSAAQPYGELRLEDFVPTDPLVRGNLSNLPIRPNDETDRGNFAVLQRVLYRKTRPFVNRQSNGASQEGKEFDFEHRLRCQMVPSQYSQCCGPCLQTMNSDDIEFVGAMMDITERKRAEEVLREQASLLNLTHDTVFVRDMHDVITYWNRGAEELYGWTREEAVGKASHRLMQTIFPAPLEEINAQLLRTGRWEGELVHTKRDGTQVIVASRWSLQRDKQGLPAATLETNNDITASKRTEATLEQAFQEIQVLKDQLYKENLALKEEIDRSSMFEEIVGASPALQAVLARAAKVAPTDSTVLITGETGTGKELIARAIHKRSQRSARAFVNVNCAAIPPSLIASELFGHEKGAFTGALQRHLGRFELAEGGTIFLDEIGELPAETQIALLRVLQEHEFERVGGNHSIRADVRVIAATNRDLTTAIAAGAFRSDLFYRLNVFPIEMPPLRDRKEDISVLVEYFIDRYASKTGKKIRSIDKKTLDLLQSYPWPGNIRELQNVIERSVIVCETETFSVDESWLSREISYDSAGKPAALRRPCDSRESND